LSAVQSEDRRRRAKTTRGAQLSRSNCLRLARGLTYEQLAERCGIGRSTLARALCDVPCEVRILLRIADILGGDPLELWPDLARSPNVLVRTLPAPVPVPAKRRRSTRVA
jgi:lambda repressor-like predicted transcriptional regulator